MLIVLGFLLTDKEVYKIVQLISIVLLALI